MKENFISETAARRGFTLIELLIVMVVIGILAGIAIPKFNSTRQRAYVSAMQADLRGLAGMQETYFADNHVYTTSTSALGFVGSEGVVLGTLTVTGTGWSATTTHSGTSEVCAVYYGDATAVSPATTAGIVTCS